MPSAGATWKDSSSLVERMNPIRRSDAGFESFVLSRDRAEEQ